MASRRKGGVANKIQKKNMEDGNFTVRESGGTVRSLSGLRSGQVSEILFMDKESKDWMKPSKRILHCVIPASGSSSNGGGTGGDRLAAVFNDEERDDFVAEPSSIFNRLAQ